MARNVNSRQSFAAFVIPERPVEQPGLKPKRSPKKNEEPPLLNDRLPLEAPIVVREPQRTAKPAPSRKNVGRKKPAVTKYLLIAVIISGAGAYLLTQPLPEFNLRDLAPLLSNEATDGKSVEQAITPAPEETAVTVEPAPPMELQSQTKLAAPVPSSTTQVQEPATPAPQPSEQQTPVATPPIFEPVTQTEPVKPPTSPYVRARIAQARRYLADGYITAPREGNAIMQLRLALYQDPENVEALELMDAASQRLMTTAKEAKQAGLDFEARNLLEELLSFHPEHVEANRLMREWLN